MQKKIRLRKKYFNIRKKKYFEIKPFFFDPLVRLIEKRYKNKFVNLSSYYPASYEVNSLIFFETKIIKKVNILLPVIKRKGSMHFYEWKKNDLLKINVFGMLEPVELSKTLIPDVMLVPLLAYDNENNRLGYGGGFYDKYLNKFLKIHKKILTVGIAFSFQKYHKIPISNQDFKLDFILTEKGIF
jgi:5-formyltetrahydrofolate cyclo-ligase